MIEIIEIRTAENGRLARLSCSCNQPQLASCQCGSVDLIYCMNCGVFTTPQRLRESIPGGSSADLTVECPKLSSSCPMLPVNLPAHVRYPDDIAEQSATIVKFSPERLMLRFGHAEPPACVTSPAARWEIHIEDAALPGIFPAHLEQALQPQSGAGMVYYEVTLDPAATAAHEAMIHFYQVRCNVIPAQATPVPRPPDQMEIASMELDHILGQAQQLQTEALAMLCETNFPLGSNASREHSVETEEFVRVLCMASETHDANSSNHLKRIAAYCAAVARQIGWSERQIAMIATASKLHDVGKMGVPDVILKKPDALTKEERRVMQQHTRFGHQILQGSSSELIRLGALIALRHHERYDGAGYPDGLAGDLIPIEAQMVSVCDVFDALTTARAYKPAWSNTQARNYLHEQSGKMFRPDLVAAFDQAWTEIEKNQLRFLDDFRDVWTERRKSPRQQTEPIPLQIEIAVPEQTFRPMRFTAAMINLSPHGMKIRVQGVTNDLFTMFMTSRRYAKLTFPALLDDADEGSFCAVVWMDYYAVPDPQTCLMGLEFQKTSPSQSSLFQELLQAHPSMV